MHWRSREERVAVREEREHDDTDPAVQSAPRRDERSRRESQRDAYKICPEQDAPEAARFVRDAAEDEPAEEAADLSNCQHDACAQINQ